MYSTLDKRHVLYGKRFTLTAAAEAFLDPLLVALCLFGALLYHGARLEARYVILALMAFGLMFPGDTRFHDRLRRVVRKKVLNWLIFVVMLGALGYATGYIHHFSREVMLTWLVATPALLIAGHEAARRIVPRLLAIEANRKTVVIAGCNDVGLRLARSFLDDRYLGVTFKGFFDDRGRARLDSIAEMPLLGSLALLGDYVREHRVEQIYLALPMATQPRILAVLDSLKDTTASIFFAPDIFVTDLIQGRMDSVGGVPVVAVCETPFQGLQGIIKRLSDIVLSSLILLAVSPAMLALAIGVKRSSPGPIIFRQRRYGLDGKEIAVYKFRSMTVCEDHGVIPQARRNDVRVTAFGAFLRRTSLDELPQFVNVLQGRMSIVGPRPHAVAHNETYRKLIKGYMVRHKVRPGITGWAQVNGCRGETETVEKMQKRIEWDLEYLRTWSLSLDTWIIIKTIWVVLRGDRHAY
ncbi:MAG: undecaprenyl-phosphate glucose phosphotransferase [Candidatus Accumulibacter sp.]|jgi:putative colanic acid biosynthesis UDP-glucose lipid carrier transferase|uniref:Undecaprenyl-phosphate glucose phosphotransferase n=2 Tax=Candidatus Accumulibacter TaxID=327159 RepID=C7RNR6_ACCRE|nr:undecaprenyl-phosphate glucose phosphotransferase [Accumulibacter sp.]MBO3714202.1 undecaprenyl-phosphate glucose phosphotransferase [Accumulibacter sp.]